MPRQEAEQGIALVVTVLAVLVLSPLAGALIMLSSMETRVTANHRRALQALYAADAALNWAVEELRGTPAWAAVRAGSSRSSLRVGAHRLQLADGSTWDLDQRTLQLTRLGAGPRQVGRGRQWRLYAHGPVAALLPRHPSGGLLWLAVWVADAGGAGPDELLVVHAAVAGPRHVRRAVQAAVRRSPALRPAVIESWVLVQ